MRREVLVALLLSGCIPSFDGITVVDDAGGASDAGSRPPDGGATLDAAALDGGHDGGAPFTPTRVDRACESAWTELDESAPPPCDGREVITLAAPFTTRAVAVARAADGRITIAYNSMDGPDRGEITTLSFDEDAPSEAEAGPSVAPDAENGETVGTDLALATAPPDIHHLAYWFRSDWGSEVRYQTLRGGVLGATQTVAGVSDRGVVDVAVDSDRRAVVAWHDDDSGANAARRELEDGGFGEAITVRNDGDPRLVGAGAMALAPGAAGRMHMAFQFCVHLAASAPSYSVSASTGWANATTLDNRAFANRASGVGIDLTTAGDEVVVAYLDWIDGFGEIRLARFTGTPADRVIEPYMAGVVIADRPGDHPLVIATDAEGLLHLLVADASASETILQYHRQTPVGDERRWIVDTIARLTATPSEIEVDMKLGPDRRPHIVYWDPAHGIRYATLRP